MAIEYVLSNFTNWTELKAFYVRITGITVVIKDSFGAVASDENTGERQKEMSQIALLDGQQNRIVTMGYVQF